jgi:biopolymer transport protein ExbB
VQNVTYAYLIHLAAYSDGVLYVLAALLLVALAVIIDRSWALRINLIRGASVIRTTAAQAALGHTELNTLLRDAGSLPEAALLDAAARHLDHATPESMANWLDESIMLIAPQLDKRLWVLDTVVTLAPLLGLFGTIIGMFHAFSVLAQPGHAPADVTAGVADALIATAFGIFIAMLGLTFFNGLHNQVRQIVHQLDSLKTIIINRTGAAAVVLPRSASRSTEMAA